MHNSIFLNRHVRRLTRTAHANSRISLTLHIHFNYTYVEIKKRTNFIWLLSRLDNQLIHNFIQSTIVLLTSYNYSHLFVTLYLSWDLRNAFLSKLHISKNANMPYDRPLLREFISIFVINVYHFWKKKFLQETIFPIEKIFSYSIFGISCRNNFS